jgi:cytosine/adenosine deaminase-related metal-dependent hydrolase
MLPPAAQNAEAQPRARLLVLRVGWLWPNAERGFGPAGVAWRAGRVVGCWPAGPDLERACGQADEVIDLPDHLALHAPINGHAHLELSGLAGRLEPTSDFGSWVRAVLAWRQARGPRGLAQDWALGRRLAAAGGACAVADIDAVGAAVGQDQSSAGGALVLPHVELLDARDPARLDSQRRRLTELLEHPSESGIGLSPHAPQTVSEALLAAAGQAARRTGWRVQVHWSETTEELDWWQGRSSPMGAWAGPSPGSRGNAAARSYLDFLDAAGLLGPQLALIHGNFPQDGEPERLAACGATLVHCPGSHRFFGRGPFPLRRYMEAGLRIALGTDSLASNCDLDLQRELALLQAEHPWLTPPMLWRMATESAAPLVGDLAGSGRLEPGAPAHLLAVEVKAKAPEQALAAWLRGDRGRRRLWIRGAECSGESAA